MCLKLFYVTFDVGVRYEQGSSLLGDLHLLSWSVLLKYFIHVFVLYLCHVKNVMQIFDGVGILFLAALMF